MFTRWVLCNNRGLDNGNNENVNWKDVAKNAVEKCKSFRQQVNCIMKDMKRKHECGRNERSCPRCCRMNHDVYEVYSDHHQAESMIWPKSQDEDSCSESDCSSASSSDKSSRKMFKFARNEQNKSNNACSRFCYKDEKEDVESESDVSSSCHDEKNTSSNGLYKLCILPVKKNKMNTKNKSSSKRPKTYLLVPWPSDTDR